MFTADEPYARQRATYAVLSMLLPLSELATSACQTASVQRLLLSAWRVEQGDYERSSAATKRCSALRVRSRVPR